MKLMIKPKKNYDAQKLENKKEFYFNGAYFTYLNLILIYCLYLTE